MFTKILANASTDVQTNSEDFFDSYESLIAEMHQFLDRLLAESKTSQDVFIIEDKDD